MPVKGRYKPKIDWGKVLSRYAEIYERVQTYPEGCELTEFLKLVTFRDGILLAARLMDAEKINWWLTVTNIVPGKYIKPRYYRNLRSLVISYGESMRAGTDSLPEASRLLAEIDSEIAVLETGEEGR